MDPPKPTAIFKPFLSYPKPKPTPSQPFTEIFGTPIKTESSPDPVVKSKSGEIVVVKIELGHKATLKPKRTPEGHTHDWMVFVRGEQGNKIEHFVDKVIFFLHGSYSPNKRVVKEPPFTVSESGYGSFTMPIEVHFKSNEEPKKVRFNYDLYLKVNSSYSKVQLEKLTFRNPIQELGETLLKAGGSIILQESMSNQEPHPCKKRKTDEGEKDCDQSSTSTGQVHQKHVKTMKKQAKKDQLERQQHEISRLTNAFVYSHILAGLQNEDVRSDFLNGANGAVQLSSEQLSQLDQLYKLIEHRPPNEQSDIISHYRALAENFISLSAGKRKDVVGTTYHSLKQTLDKIVECKYFTKAFEPVEESSASSDELPEEEQNDQTNHVGEFFGAAEESEIIQPVHESDEIVVVKIELGHKATLKRRQTFNGHTHDWTVFIRGEQGNKIEHFIDKVIFFIRSYPIKRGRVVKKPPFTISGSGYASFTMPIDVYFKSNEEPKKLRFMYYLKVKNGSYCSNIQLENLTFKNPTQELREELLKAGGFKISQESMSNQEPRFCKKRKTDEGERDCDQSSTSKGNETITDNTVTRNAEDEPLSPEFSEHLFEQFTLESRKKKITQQDILNNEQKEHELRMTLLNLQIQQSKDKFELEMKLIKEMHDVQIKHMEEIHCLKKSL